MNEKISRHGIRGLAVGAISLAALAACGGGSGNEGRDQPDGGAFAPHATAPTSASPQVPESIDRTAKPMELPDTVWPVNYKLWFRPDAQLKTFAGRGDVEIDVREPVDAIVVAAHDLDFVNGRTMLRSLSTGQSVELVPTPQTPGDFVQMRRSDGRIAKGKYVLHMEWTGSIQFSDAQYCPEEALARNPLCSAATGLFRVGLASPEGQSSDALVTQGETNFARQWFPGWDEPAFRHTFEISAEVPGHWKTVSNGELRESAKLPDGYQRVAFEKTPSMPMYLTFFGGGNFDVLADKFTSPLDGTTLTLRWFTPPGRAEWARDAMQWSKEALDFYYRYTNAALPFNKLDTVAANDSYDNKPNTGFGGMENWGAIFEFADAALTKPGDTPTNYSVRLVTHEIAHQWFGDLVTLDWWDNVWLNESFATWFEYRTMIKLRPSYYTWPDYVLNKHQVMSADLRGTAVPVQRNLSDAGSFHFIDPSIFVYNKGSHVLQTIENYIGEDAMRKGIQIYLKDYAMGNATPSRLWSSLEKAAGGKKVADIGDSFIRQTGVPLITVDAQCAGDKTYVNVAQEPFPNANMFPASSWAIPVSVAYGGSLDKRTTFVLKDLKAQFELPGCTAVLANPTGSGYYVTNYSAASWSDLLAKVQALAGDSAALLNIERDAFRLQAAGRLTPAQYEQVKQVLKLSPAMVAKAAASQKKSQAPGGGFLAQEHPHAHGLAYQGNLKLRANVRR